MSGALRSFWSQLRRPVRVRKKRRETKNNGEQMVFERALSVFGAFMRISQTTAFPGRKPLALQKRMRSRMADCVSLSLSLDLSFMTWTFIVNNRKQKVMMFFLSMLTSRRAGRANGKVRHHEGICRGCREEGKDGGEEGRLHRIVVVCWKGRKEVVAFISVRAKSTSCRCCVISAVTDFSPPLMA